MTSEGNNKIALFDICHTIVPVTTISDFTARYLLNLDRNPKFSVFKKLYHYVYRIGRKLHLMSHAHYRMHYVRLYKGYSAKDIDVLAQAYAKELEGLVKPEMKAQLQNHVDVGYTLFLVSAGFDVYLKYFAQNLGFNLVCTELEITNGVFSGKIKGIDCLGEGKASKIKSATTDVDWEHSVAYGDDKYDIPMLSLVGNPCAIDPTLDLVRHAIMKGWKIITTANGNISPYSINRLSKMQIAVRLGIKNVVIGAFKKAGLFLLWIIFRFDRWHAIRPFETTNYKKMIVALAEGIVLQEGTVIDIGCGLGDILCRIDADHKYGFDIDSRAIACARFLSIISFKQRPSYRIGSLDEALQLPIETVDLLIMGNWLHSVSDVWIEDMVPQFLARKHVRYILVDESAKEQGRIESIFKKFATLVRMEYDWQDGKRIFIFKV